jgi:hypothetical protein
VQPSRVFQEVAETLTWALTRLGYPARLAERPSPGQEPAIVLGAQVLPARELAALPAGSVLYNLEQVDDHSSWLTPPVLRAFHRYPVWDYSRSNCRTWARLGVSHPLWVPIGYVPELTRIPRLSNPDVDVLFYGTPNPRRLRILEALKARGVRVVAGFGIYGAERDALIARAKLVLNVHYYPLRIFEVVRVSYLLANGKAVVAECDPDTDMEDDLRDAVCTAPYDGLVDACRELLAHPGAREELAERGYARMAARDATAIVAEALKLTVPQEA